MNYEQKYLISMALKSHKKYVFFLRGSVRPFPAYLLQVAVVRVLGNIISPLITRTPELILRYNRHSPTLLT
jgi:hypothetical protein